LANFNAGTGTSPTGALLLIGDSTFYGLALTGGANSGGSLFSYKIGGTINKLVDLPVNAYPSGSLIQASDGQLYGLTNQDGAHRSGTIFSYNIGTTVYTPLYSLPSYAHPPGSLLEVGADTLYGMAANDSIRGPGTIFRFITATGNYTLLTYLPHATHTESSLIRATDGLLYGMTMDGGTYSAGLYSGGTLFSYNTGTGAYDTLHNFGGGTDGGYPLGDLYQASDGILYGMTNEGGTDNIGTIFKYNITTHTYTRLVSLDTTTGYFPGPGHLSEYKALTTILTQPQSTTACVGTNVSFTASASGNNTIQWQESTTGGSNFSAITGATDTTYSFTATGAQNGYQYRAVFISGGVTDTSSVANLTVNTINDTTTVSASVCTAAQSGAVYQWRVCDSQLTISGAVNQSYTAPNGSYQCIVQSGNCVDTTNCVTVTGVGIFEIQGYNFSLYPNPTNGLCVIEHNYTGPVTIQVINILGEKLKEFNITGGRAQLDISDLAAGIYLVQFSNNKQVMKVLKVVKE
jgi:uncharacterized repeat protein (TIGR03803 family)